ncbi:Glycosyltransferase [Heracleum sosnowskyi]|uniref:Glycosyltransferase n=1 Tax=Heracleum sosnowskyi TaxID=360622 RepID=A0AAD8IG06_9APIA|nr:Glycosyltransferase [Heracleum sosnowskyi]
MSSNIVTDDGSSPPPPHVVLFPFMSKGHIIPALHLALLFHRHGANVTIFTTPANHPFMSKFLSNTSTNFIDLPFPKINGIPPGVESTDKLPSMALIQPFLSSTILMQEDFEQALKTLPTVTFMVTDMFLGWTLDSASKFGIPRLSFGGCNVFTTIIFEDLILKRPELLLKKKSDEVFENPNFPSIKLTTNHFDTHLFCFKFLSDQLDATSKSYGIIVNSFSELEPRFLEFWNTECKPKAWCLGPLCMAEPQPSQLFGQEEHPWMNWLDTKKESSVLYVAFGSQAEFSKEQTEEIKSGLESSHVNFLWVVRKSENLDEGFEERVKGRGIVVKDWVDQRRILGHESVKGFMSHCGWNSVTESICAKVPILAWPMGADQPLNSIIVVDEIKVGLLVETCDGSMRGFVKGEGLERTVRELMEGEMGKTVRKRVEEVGELAMKAVEEGGSSWINMSELIHQTCVSNNTHVTRTSDDALQI